jgi:hypothetical protein
MNREALAQRGTGLGLAIVKFIAERPMERFGLKENWASIFYLPIPLV